MLMTRSSKRLAMQIEYQLCRTLGHGWEPFIPFGKRASGWGQRLSIRCWRCLTERHDTIDMRGALSSRHYDYADEYTLNQDEKPSRDQLRRSICSFEERDVVAAGSHGETPVKKQPTVRVAAKSKPRQAARQAQRAKPAAKRTTARARRGNLRAVG